MSSQDPETPDPLLSRDELVTLVARVHHGAAYGESALAGRSLAAQSKLPKIIAVNLGAGFGQWDFFPEASDIVDFAFAYAPPATEEELWALARRWASDDANRRHTVLALVGREILLHELRRIEIPKLREVVADARGSRVRELRESLGLEVPPAKPERKRAGPRAAAPPGAGVEAGPRAGAPSAAGTSVAAPRGIPTRMPKPELKRAPPPPPPPPPKRFHHPKFGDGMLEAKDGDGPEAKLTIRFEGGTKTLQAKFVSEL